MSLFARRPSPAMIVAVVALSFALAGSAIAGTDAATRDVSKSQVKKIAKKQAKKQINKLASGLSVANAQNAQNAVNAQNAENAQTAVVGSAAAYASINFNGTVETDSPSKNISNATVDNIDTGSYCFDLPFDPVTAAANANQNGEADEDGVLTYSLNPDDYFDCPSSAEAEVRNIDAGDSSAQDDDFNVQFDG
jgi:hypothetical protein